MKSQSERTANKESAGNAAAVAMWLVASIAIFLLLIAIPKDMAIGSPGGLHCDVYALARRGWGCAKLGDFFSNPTLLLVALALLLLSALWFGRDRRMGMPWFAIFLLQVAFPVLVAGLIRLAYFVQGKVNTEHGKLTAILLGCMIVCVFSSYKYSTSRRNRKH